MATQVALVVKNPPASAGDVRVEGQSLGQGDALEEGMAAHSSVPKESNGQRSLVSYSPWGSQRARPDWSNLAHMHETD